VSKSYHKRTEEFDPEFGEKFNLVKRGYHNFLFLIRNEMRPQLMSHLDEILLFQLFLSFFLLLQENNN